MVVAPRAISTFAGGGGSSTGLELAGFKVLASIEFDAMPATVYRMNHPGTHLFERDIRTVSVEEILEATGLTPGDLDLVDGSPPCQAFSKAANQRVTSLVNDKKNNLAFEYARIIKGLQPRAFVMENVDSMTMGRNVGKWLEIKNALEDAGYVIRSQIIDFAYLGVPQHRRRTIIQGARRDLGITPEPIRPQTQPVSVMDALGRLPAPLVPDTKKWQKENNWCSRTWAGTRLGKSFDTSPYAKTHARPGKRPSGWNHIRIDPDKPCNTITVTANQWHWSENRTLSTHELIRLGTFPDNYKWPDKNTLNAVQHVIGNSVPPEAMRRIALHIRETILNG